MTLDASLDEHILAIVQSQSIAEQQELQEELKKRGYEVPQATLSRRLKKLKIAKVAGIYAVIETPRHLPRVLSMKVSEFGMIVLHTEPANANSLASYLDRKYVSFTPEIASSTGILATLAGDDTILLVIENKEKLAVVLALLQNEFPYL